jgi:hypothetical protein
VTDHIVPIRLQRSLRTVPYPSRNWRSLLIRAGPCTKLCIIFFSPETQEMQQTTLFCI